MRAKSVTHEEEHPHGLLGRSDDPYEVAARAFETVTIPISQFYDDPVGFVKEFIDFGKPAKGTQAGLTTYQKAILGALPLEKRLAVRSPHGAGKTTTVAFVVLWFAITRDDAGVDWKCVTTAGAWRQLEKYLWPEIRKWSRRLRWDRLGLEPWRDKKELMTLSLNLEHGEAFAAASSDKQKIEGAHADSLLYVFDESKAIDADIFDAAEGAFSGADGLSDDGTPADEVGRALEAMAVATSTPGDTQGRFYDIHMRKPGFEDWSVMHVTVKQVIAAGRISETWRAARERQWGVDSALYANRVLGQFHSSAADTVIPLAWAEAAIERWHEWKRSGRRKHARTRVLGVDVARGGKDSSVIGIRRGEVVEGVTKLALASTTEVTAAVQVRLESGDEVVVDVVGVGGGVYDQLRKEEVQVRPFTASGKSFRRDISGQMGFLNRRAEMWWGMRERLDPSSASRVCLPPDDDLLAELVTPKWTVTAGNRIQVEGKDEIKKRLNRSTDTADAVLQTFTSPESPDSGMDSVQALVAHMYSLPESMDDWQPGTPHTADGGMAFGTGAAESFYEWGQE